MFTSQHVTAVQLHTLVYFKNCSDLKLLDGRRYNLKGAFEIGQVLDNKIDFGQLVSDLGFHAAISAQHKANECLELSKILASEARTSFYRDRMGINLNVAIDRLTFSIRILSKEVREGR